ncbi:MAG: hypothetical protein WC623_21820 [Pedobacter sp.]
MKMKYRDVLEVAPPCRGGLGKGKAKEKRLNIARMLLDAWDQKI